MIEQVDAILEEQADLAKVIAITEAAAKRARDPFAWEVSLQGLRARQEALQAEERKFWDEHDPAECFTEPTDIIVAMPPKRSYSVKVKLMSVRKGEPCIIVPDVLMDPADHD